MSTIDSLDLRSPDAIEAEALDRRLDALWPWPQFPERVQRWIAAGDFANEFAHHPGEMIRKLVVEVTGNMRDFENAMRRTIWLMEHRRAQRQIMYSMLPPNRLRPLSQWRWDRVFFWLGYFFAEATCAYVIVWWVL